jgi:hypothetical protein
MRDGNVKESIQSFIKTLMYQQWQNHMHGDLYIIFIIFIKFH